MTDCTNALVATIKLFESEARHVPQFVRSFVRGTGLDDEKFVHGWSDLDLSIVVSDMTRECREGLRVLFIKLRESFDGKVSLTVVTAADFAHALHHHGSKPMHYSERLRTGVNGYGQVESTSREWLETDPLRLDTFCNIAYLVHDLRSRDLLSGLPQRLLFDSVVHTCKRSKHIARNGVWLKVGDVGEELVPHQVASAFPSLPPDFCWKWSAAREELICMANSPIVERLSALQEYLMSQVEAMYEDAQSLINGATLRISEIPKG